MEFTREELACSNRIYNLNRGRHRIFMDQVAKFGLLHSVKWLNEIGIQFNEWTITFAAGGGHLGLVKWLRAKDCPWSDMTMRWAACHGHLEVIIWLRENGCPWSKKVARDAAESGYPDIAKLLTTPPTAMSCPMAGEEWLFGSYRYS